MNMRLGLNRSLPACVAALAMCLSLPAGAATCSLSATGLNFGVYDLVNAISSTSSITLSCSRSLGEFGNRRIPYQIELSTGGGSYAAREMVNGTSIMRYNLYADATRTAVWGDGTGGSVPVDGILRIPPFALSEQTEHTVYGMVFPNQGDLESGTYFSSPITVIVSY